jgi:hypothetical protein
MEDDDIRLSSVVRCFETETVREEVEQAERPTGAETPGREESTTTA